MKLKKPAKTPKLHNMEDGEDPRGIKDQRIELEGYTPFKLQLATRSKRKNGHNRAAPMFNPIVSKVKFHRNNFSTRLGAKENLAASDDDFSNPPLSTTSLSFGDDFSVVSGVPAFIFNGDQELDEPKEPQASKEPKLQYTTSSRLLPGTELDPVNEDSAMITPRAKFRSAAVAVALTTRIKKRKSADPPKRKGSQALLNSLTVREENQQHLLRTKSMPNVRQAHITPSEACSPYFFTSKRHKSPILCSVFDSTGNRLASGHGNGFVRVWNSQRGHLVEVLQDIHTCAVAACQFTMDNMLATCDISGKLILWDLNPNVSARAPPKVYPLEMDIQEDENALVAPEFSNDGQYLAVRPMHEKLRVSDLTEAWGVSVLARRRCEYEISVRFDSLFLQFTTCVHPQSCDLYQKLTYIRGGRDSMPQLPQQSSVHVALWDTTDLYSSLHNPIELTYMAEGLWDHNLQVRAMCFVANGSDWGLKVCIQDEYKDFHGFNNVETAVLVWPSVSHTGDVAVLDGMHATGSPSLSLIATWNPKAKWGPGRGACFLWDMRNFMTHSVDDDKECLGDLGRTPDSSILRDSKMDVIFWCAFVNENQLVASVGRDTLKMLVWDVALGSKVYTLETGIEPCTHLCSLRGDFASVFSPVCGGGVVWNIVSGLEILKLDIPDDLEIDSAMWVSYFAPEGCRLVSAGASDMIVWNLNALDTQDGTNFLVRHEADRNVQMRRCRVSLDGSVVGIELFMRESRMSLLDIWNLKKGTVATLPHERTVGSSEIFHKILAFNLSHNGNHVLTWGADGRAVVWDVHNPFVRDISSFKGPEGLKLLDCCFVGDEKGITGTNVACLKDGIILWWENGEEIARVQTKNQISSCEFCSTGAQAVFMLSDMRTVQVWDLIRRIHIRTTEFGYDLRQLNKPAVVSGWPLPVSPDGASAFLGLGKDTWEPTFCTPSTPIEELKCKVGLVANSVAFTRSGEAVAMADFTNIHTQDHKLHDDASCVWVMNLRGHGDIKELCGLSRSVRSLAISGNGKTVACISGSSTLTVWGPFACKGCIPDFNQIMQSPRLTSIAMEYRDDEEVVVIKDMLKTYGPRILNYPDCYGLSIFMHAVLQKKLPWLEAMVEEAKLHKLKLGFRRLENTFSSEPMNAIQEAIRSRVPEVLELLLEFLLEGHISDAEICQVLKDSMLDLLRVYPATFLKFVSDSRLLCHQGEVLVPEEAFNDNGLLVTTSDAAHPPLDHVDSFWKRLESNALETKEGVKVKAIAKYVPYPNIAQVGSKGLLRHLLASNAPIQVFGTAVVRGVIQYKWKTYGRRIMVENIVFYGMNLIIFTFYSLCLGLKGHHTGYVSDKAFLTISSTLLVISSPLSLWKLCRLIRQFFHLWRDQEYGGWSGVKYWLFSGYRWFEGATLFLVAFVTPILHIIAFAGIGGDRIKEKEVHGLVAGLSILLWWNMLYYILPFRPTGPLVLIIQEIMKDMSVFLLLGLIVLGGFSIAFFVLFSRHGCDGVGDDIMGGGKVEDDFCQDQSIHNAFGTLTRTVVTTFGMMLGEFETDWFFDGPNAVFSAMLWMLYMMIMTVILLNMLIAIMGATFQKVIQTEEIHFLRIKARVIDDMETIISSNRQQRLEKRIGTYLHVLVPVHLAENSFRMASQLLTGSWQKSFSEMVAAGVESMEAKITRVTDTQKGLRMHQDAIKSNQSVLMSDMQTVKEQVQMLTKQMGNDGEEENLGRQPSGDSS